MYYYLNRAKAVCMISDPKAAAENNMYIIGAQKSIYQPKIGMDIR